MAKNVKERLQSVDAYVSMALGLAVVLVIGTLVYNFISKKPGTTAPAGQANVAEKQNPAQAKLPATHEVAAGETLWSIAEKYYGSGYNWVDIANANNLANPDLIENGQSLTIPNVKPVIEPQGQISALSTDISGTKYTVVKGDYLWKIAVDKYGNGFKWGDIARLNNLSNPGTIHAGNILTLP